MDLLGMKRVLFSYCQLNMSNFGHINTHLPLIIYDAINVKSIFF